MKNEIFNEKDSIQNSNKFFIGRSVVLLAMQYCIKQNVRKIILTGVDFNYEKGYINKSITNTGLNEPAPLVAKKQLIALIKLCEEIGISVEHPFN